MRIHQGAPARLGRGRRAAAACALLLTLPALAQAMSIRELRTLEANEKDGKAYASYYLVGVLEGLREGVESSQRNGQKPVFCVEGRGAVTFEERDAVPLVPGSLVSLPAGLAHRIEAAPDSRMVVIYTTNAGYTSVRPHREAGDTGARLPGEQGG